MHEFFFKDKNSNKIIRGISPHNDVDCDPFEYFRLNYAFLMFRQMGDFLRILNAEQVPEELLLDFVLKEVDKMIAGKLSSSKPSPEIHQLFSDETLDKNHQNKLLKGLNLKTEDILWLNKEAHDMGYLLDVYHEEKIPEKFKKQQMPNVFHQEKDGTMEHFGNTDMTEGDMRALLEQRKVIQARIYHKGETWHCFYFTFRGLNGLENGFWGSKPHYHYLSNKSGISWSNLMTRVKACDMPSSNVYVVIDKS